MYYVIFATDKPGSEAVREQARPAHRRYLRDPGGGVTVHIGGPTFDDAGEKMNGTMLVVEANSREAVDEFLANDPYGQAGLFGNVVVRPWHWGLGKPEEGEA